MRAFVERANLGEHVSVDSCGTHAYHVGELPDVRSRRAATVRGYSLTHRARVLVASDYEHFDYLLAMDTGHLGILRKRAPERARARVELFRAFDPEAAAGSEVPDPYYGEDDGFVEVLDMVERACKGLLDHISRTHRIG